jgi:hypothetical protein
MHPTFVGFQATPIFDLSKPLNPTLLPFLFRGKSSEEVAMVSVEELRLVRQLLPTLLQLKSTSYR